MPFRADATRLLDYVPTATERCFTFFMVSESLATNAVSIKPYQMLPYRKTGLNNLENNELFL